MFIIQALVGWYIMEFIYDVLITVFICMKVRPTLAHRELLGSLKVIYLALVRYFVI